MITIGGGATMVGAEELRESLKYIFFCFEKKGGIL